MIKNMDDRTKPSNHLLMAAVLNPNCEANTFTKCVDLLSRRMRAPRIHVVLSILDTKATGSTNWRELSNRIVAYEPPITETPAPASITTEIKEYTSSELNKAKQTAADISKAAAQFGKAFWRGRPWTRR